MGTRCFVRQSQIMAAETNIFPNLLRILATKIKNAQRGQKGLRPVH